MINYFMRRIFQAILTLLLVCVTIFAASRASGDPVALMLGDNPTQEEVAAMEKQLGLDQPLSVQFFSFISGALRGDLGKSYNSNKPVISLIMSKLPNSILLACFAMMVAFILTFILGTLSAVYEDSWFDRVVRGFAGLAQAVPVFFVGIIFIQVFGVKLRLLPVSGFKGFSSLIMPGVILGIAVSAGMILLLRNNMIEVLNSEYIKLSRLKGLPEWLVVVRHGLRNAIVGLLSLSSFIFSHLIAGSIVIESVFSWPGIGMLSYNAIIGRDFPLIQGIVLILACMILIISFAVDIVLSIVDPRIRNKL